MPGIIGFVESNFSNDPGNLLNTMAEALLGRASDQISIYSDEHIHLGSVRLGAVSQEAKLTRMAEHNLVVVISGEIFGYEAKKQWLRERGYSIQDGDTAQFVANLYLEEGEDCICGLNGAFAAAIWDGRSGKLLLANDRMGYEPLYYAQTNMRFLFGTGARSLLADPALSRTINHLGMAQFLTYDHVLGNRTFLENVHLLPPGSILTLVEGQVKIRAYWQLQFPEVYPMRSEADYQEELIFLLRQATARQRPEQPAGILLSGGLDSRVILALLSEKPPSSSLKAFTMGSPDSDDVRYARELAKHLHIQHEFDPLRSDYLIEQSEQGIRITDGMESVIHMHTLDSLSAQAAQVKILYKGFLGDALTGYFSFRDLMAQYSPEDLFKAFFERYPIIFNPTSYNQLFVPDIKAQLQEQVLETARAELLYPESNRLAADLFFQFDLRQRQRRLTVNGVRLVGSQAIVRTPFYDNDVVDFMLRVPQGYRLGRYLMTQTFIKTFPELAKIPYTGTGFPLMPCRRDLLMRLDRHTRWRLKEAGLKWVKVPGKRSYARYNEWLRGKLRPWMEEILLSKRLSERGILNPDYVKSLVAEHLAGQNHASRLGVLISIELWHRQFIDR